MLLCAPLKTKPKVPMSDLTMHGIANCDAIKKAKKWLTEAGINYHFRDYKKQPPTLQELQIWATMVDWETLLNKRGTTWRQLPTEQQADIKQAKALQLLADNPSMIKRPLLIQGQQALVGFQADQYVEFIA